MKTSDARRCRRYARDYWVSRQESGPLKTAEALLDQTSAEGYPIYIPSICLVELTYLVEKDRLPAAARQVLIRALDDPSGPYALAALDHRVADALESVPRSEVADLPDRIIAATAVALKVPLVSRDRKIRASMVNTIW